MNKKFIKVALVAAIAMVGGVNVFNAQKVNTLSDVALGNVEALADGEIGNGGTGRWKRIVDSLGCYLYHKCDGNGDGYTCSPLGATTIIP